MKKLFTVRNIIITLSVLLFLFIAAQKAGIISNDHKTKVITDTVATRNITETVSGSGKIQPVTQVKISSDVSGEITEMLVKEGDMVHKGDLLCRIKQDIYLSNLERMEATVNSSKAGSAQSKARLAQSKAQLINSENLYKRNQKLFDSGVLSQQDFDAAKAQYETAKAEVEAAHEALEAANYNISNAEAGLREAQNNLSRTSIYSPVDGKVSKLNVEKGERVVGTAQMTGTEIMTIANLNEMEVRVDINENDIIYIKINDTAHIEVDAYFDKKFKGIVTEISNSANITGMNTDQVTNFTVNIRILQESYKHLIPPNMPDYSPFRPGMSASVDIETNRVSKVLSIPVEAVTTRNDTTAYGSTKSKRKALSENKKQNKENSKSEKEQEYVFVFNNDKAVLKPVTTGIQDNNYIEIKQGLSLGEEVIIGPYKSVSKLLKNKTPVKKVSKDELFENEDSE
ncbi:MAG: efflux RND transporter periplasmic adaptor subunit [Bacteroidia bacterium]|nr:efflux RND transporter periplasmic adaptor subunit [Bacteroidia bacterium]MCZ2248495.1 efflux RND transporter periplasmic adaptor subunit [Bacteroidia bacterium]